MKAKHFFLLSLLALTPLGSSCTPTNENVLLIGLECNYAPFNWTETKQNEYTFPIYNQSGKYADGYDIQIAKAISAELGREIRIITTQWESLIPDLQLGSLDLVIAGMTDTEERRQSISFTDEYYHSELVLVVASDVAQAYPDVIPASQFASFISEKIVVSQVETVTDEVIEEVFTLEYGALRANPVASFALAAVDVANGSAFAMTAELPVAKSIVASNPNLGIVHIDQNILGEKRAALGVSIGVRKNDDELRASVNSVLSKITSAERETLMEDALERSRE